MGHPVEGFAEVDSGSNDSFLIFRGIINVAKDEVDHSYDVVNNRTAREATKLIKANVHKGFVDLFYDFWIQKSHHFYGFWIQKLFCPFLQFLDPETAVFLRFLDPETAPFLQFLDPEFFWSIFTISGSRNCSIFEVSGSRNRTISAISGSSNEPARMSLLFCYPPMG